MLLLLVWRQTGAKLLPQPAPKGEERKTPVATCSAK
jgi:hypothetical protein